MKVRNIFIGCLSLLMAFTACNEEIIIENEGIETASFSLSFLANTTAGNIATKAGEQIATEDELYVGDCFIAIYSGESSGWDRLISWHTYTVNQSKEFAIDIPSLPINTPLKIVAVANPPALDGGIKWEKASYSSIRSFSTTYGTLGGTLSDGSKYYTFNPKSLVKVGEGIIQFNADGSITRQEGAIKDGVFHLTQLAARVDLDLTVESPETKPEAPETIYDFGGTTPETVVKALSTQINSLQDKDFPGYIYSDGTFVKDNPSAAYIATVYNCKDHVFEYNGQKINPNSDKIAHLTGASKKVVTRTPNVRVLSIKSIVIDNVETQSQLMMRNEELTALRGNTISSSNPTSRLRLTFYTYEKSFYPNDLSKVLKVSIVGNLAIGSQELTEEYSLEGVHCIALDQTGNPTSWGKLKKFVLLPIGETGGKLIEQITIKEQTEQELTYNISINPVRTVDCATNGFVRGNQYVVTGTLSTSRLPANGMLDVNIAPATPYSPEIKFTFD